MYRYCEGEMSRNGAASIENLWLQRPVAGALTPLVYAPWLRLRLAVFYFDYDPPAYAKRRVPAWIRKNGSIR